VMPMRAFSDRQLKERDLRVLGALCSFTNRAGVCWPSMETLCNVSGYAERKTVHDSMKVLKRLRYVRQLRSKDYQRAQSGWKTNRYQVLWYGDEPMPSYEEVHIAKPLQLRADQEDDHAKEVGGLGGEEAVGQTRGLELLWAFLRACEEVTGQALHPDNNAGHVGRLLAREATVAEVREATLAVCREALERRAGVPSRGRGGVVGCSRKQTLICFCTPGLLGLCCTAQKTTPLAPRPGPPL